MAEQLLAERSLQLELSKQAFSAHEVKCNPPEKNVHHHKILFQPQTLVLLGCIRPR